MMAKVKRRLLSFIKNFLQESICSSNLPRAHFPYCQGRHEFTVTDEHRRNARHGYYGMISYVDDKVAQLRKTLEACKLADDTIIILTADHGEMMGERGMCYKQHFFEWAARVPLIIHTPKRWKPSRVSQNVSLIDLMPTLLDAAVDGPFDGYVGDGIDGKSLVPALAGDAGALDDLAISEFAADGSTGPSRMVRKGPWKYMYLEGVDELLYNVEADPKELDNKIEDPAAASVAAELRLIAFDGWDPDELRKTIRRDQEHRLLIHRTTDGEPTWVNIVRTDDNDRYIRNAGAADTKAKARLPYVPPARPDELLRYHPGHEATLKRGGKALSPGFFGNIPELHI